MKNRKRVGDRSYLWKQGDVSEQKEGRDDNVVQSGEAIRGPERVDSVTHSKVQGDSSAAINEGAIFREEYLELAFGPSLLLH